MQQRKPEQRERERENGHAGKVIRPGTSQRTCVLIILPDWLDLLWFREQCEYADRLATLQVEGKSKLPGLRMHALYTYPELWAQPGSLMAHALTHCERVYIGHRRRVKWWQQPRTVMPVGQEQILGMHPSWQERMRLGDPYLWVSAKPNAVPEEWPLPDVPRTWPLPWLPGVLAPVPAQQNEVIPHWFAVLHRQET